MMLYIGGHAQGKLAAALEDTGYPETAVCDGGGCPLERLPKEPVLNRLHLLIRRLMEDGQNPSAYLDALCESSPNLVVVCDEVGCGIVPTDRFERDWREATGRACCVLAQRSVRVTRVYAGLSTVIKDA